MGPDFCTKFRGADQFQPCRKSVAVTFVPHCRRPKRSLRRSDSWLTTYHNRLLWQRKRPGCHCVFPVFSIPNDPHYLKEQPMSTFQFFRSKVIQWLQIKIKPIT